MKWTLFISLNREDWDSMKTVERFFTKSNTIIHHDQ